MKQISRSYIYIKTFKLESFNYYPCSLSLNAYQAKIHIDNIFKDLPTCFVCEQLVNSSSQKNIDMNGYTHPSKCIFLWHNGWITGILYLMSFFSKYIEQGVPTCNIPKRF